MPRKRANTTLPRTKFLQSLHGKTRGRARRLNQRRSKSYYGDAPMNSSQEVRLTRLGACRQSAVRNVYTDVAHIGLDVPFLLLPFRPASDPSATRTFIRNFFGANSLTSNPPRGEMLMQELRLTEPLVRVRNP